MTAVWSAGLLAAAGLLLAVQLGRAFGPWRGVPAALLLTAAAAGGWWLLSRNDPVDAAPADWAAVPSVSSETCAKCHAEHYESWHRTFHRTMTRDAAPDTVKGNFDNAVYDYQGVTTKFTREGDRFFMTTVDPGWALAHAQAPGRDIGSPVYRKLSVDRTVGSHWVQEYMHRETNGRFTRMPILYHIVEQRWVHSHGAFLAPDSPDFWAKCRGDAWNDTCLYCHNTGPVKNPQRLGREVVGYKTEVAELGISCEACHGPGGEHVQLNHNPARRLALQKSSSGDPSIVDPARLSVERRDQICARCHGALEPKPQMWDLRSVRDPFIAGQDLLRFNHYFHSEAQRRELRGLRVQGPEPADGRFWGDGTPLTTALEYNGMALSACYQNGHGSLSCLSCHQLHGEKPEFLLKPGMSTNEACLQCHGEYRDRLTEHTKHAGDSAGSLCYNCHMPHQVFSLLTTHRSHRIQIPEVKDSLDTGKPNACNLCHLDKSLGWTQQQLGRWSESQRRKAVKLSDDQEQLSAALLLLTTADARSRAVVAGAFANPAAQAASGVDWYGPFLTRLLQEERYPMVRYLAYRGLQTAHGDAARPYDYMAAPARRDEHLRVLRERFDASPVRRPLPYLPLTPQGLPDEAVLRRLLNQRRDPDVQINE